MHEDHPTTIAILNSKQHGWRDPHWSSLTASSSSWTRSSTMCGILACIRGCTANIVTAFAHSTVGSGLEIVTSRKLVECRCRLWTVRSTAARAVLEPLHWRCTSLDAFFLCVLAGCVGWSPYFSVGGTPFGMNVGVLVGLSTSVCLWCSNPLHVRLCFCWTLRHVCL